MKIQVGDLVQYHRNALGLAGRFAVVVGLRPIHPGPTWRELAPFWAEVRFTDNPHHLFTCKVDNLQVISTS